MIQRRKVTGLFHFINRDIKILNKILATKRIVYKNDSLSRPSWVYFRYAGFNIKKICNFPCKEENHMIIDAKTKKHETKFSIDLFSFKVYFFVLERGWVEKGKKNLKQLP